MNQLAATQGGVGGRGPRSGLHVVDETDGYTSAVAGVTIEAVRIGRGTGPNVVFGVHGEHMTLTSSRIRFPMTACASIPDDRLAIAYVHENDNSRWCGVELKKGSVIVYPPGAQHDAINRPGLRFTFVTAEPERLVRAARTCDLAVELPTRPALVELPRSSATERIGMALNGLAASAVSEEAFDRHSESALVALAEALATEPSGSDHPCCRGLDSRTIVRACIEYAEAIDRIPSIVEMCTAAHVSVRRLRSAFHDEFDRSPTHFFRTWALHQVHCRLRDLDPHEGTVTEVACAAGFDHLGRFAGWYRDVYGETPSTTLRMSAN